MRRLLLGVLAVVALFAASIGGLILLERPAPVSGGPTPPGAAPQVAAPAAEPPVVQRAPVVAQAPPSERPSPPLSLARPAPVEPRRGDWEQIPPARLESVPTLSMAIDQARPRLAPCSDPEVQGRYGRRPFTALGTPHPGTGPAVVVLQLEAGADGRVRVVDAPVETRGAAEDGLLACFQEQVRGLELPGSGSPGARYRVRYTLTAMIQGLPQKQIRQQRFKPKQP